MKEKARKLMEEQILQMGKDLELIEIFQSGDKYVGTLKEKGSEEAYENVLVYDTADGSIKRVHIMTAMIEFPKTEKERLREIG